MKGPILTWRRAQSFAISARDFLKSFWVLCIVLIVIVFSTAYIMILFYQASSRLVEANRRSFVQRVRTDTAILDNFLRQRAMDIKTLSRSKALQSYYQNKALGMSLEYGLAVSLAAVNQEFERFLTAMQEDGHPIFLGIAFFDQEDHRIIAESGSSHHSGRITDRVIELIEQNPSTGQAFLSTIEDARCQLFLFRHFTYKGHSKGYLVMTLNLDLAHEKIRMRDPATKDDFSGLVDSSGILISGPQLLVGKNLPDVLGVSHAAMRGLEISEVPIPPEEIGIDSLVIAGSNLLDTGLSLIRVEPSSKYATGAPWILWAAIFSAWTALLMVMLFLIFRGFAERQKMYGKLQEAYDNLEVRVEERTADLVQANLALKREMEEREKAEKAVVESEAKYRELAELLPQIVFETDVTGKFTFVNHSGLTAMGYTSKDFRKGIRVSEVVSPEDQDRLLADFGGVLRGEANSGKDYTLRRNDGTVFPVVTYGVPIVQDAKIVGVRGVAVDITELRQVQAALSQAQKMEAIGTLAAGIAHDFNNMLTVIHGFSELLLMGKAESDSDYADLWRILQTARKGADLVQQILAFSRKVEIRLRPLDLNQEVKGTLQMLSRTIPKTITIDTFLADGLKRINADPSQIQQVLLNLAINAIDAMPDGGRLVIETENALFDNPGRNAYLGAQTGEYVLLRVSDTGSGMDKEIQNHIFEPFFSTKEPGRGTGLGLSVVFGTVQAHGGCITCQSNPGNGTSFEICLPIIDGEEKCDAEFSGTNPAPGTETILLVDDEEFVRDLGTRILSRAGYRVLTAADGKKAIEIYGATKDEISLVLLDLTMPNMGGKECLEHLLRIDPAAKVLIATGHSREAASVESLLSRVRGFVAKPYNIQEILQAIREALDSD
jgi:PAS domain S-box-containing protein